MRLLLLLTLALFLSSNGAIAEEDEKEKEDKRSFFQRLTESANSLLNDVRKFTIDTQIQLEDRSKKPTLEGLDLFKKADKYYSKYQEYNIKTPDRNNRTLTFFALAQQPLDGTNAATMPSAALIYNKPNLFGDTDFTFISFPYFYTFAELASHFNFNYIWKNSIEVQQQIAGNTLYQDGNPIYQNSYLADQYRISSSLVFTRGETSEFTAGISSSSRVYRHASLNDDSASKLNSEFDLPENHAIQTVFTEGIYGSLVSSLKFVLEETKPIDGYAFRYRFSNNQRSDWSAWQDGTESSSDFESRKEFITSEVSFHWHYEINNLDEFMFQAYYGKVFNADRENSFRIGGVGDPAIYKRLLHGYYDQEFVTEEFALFNSRYSFGVNEENRIMFYYDHLIARNDSLRLIDDNELTQHKGVGLAYQYTQLDGDRYKFDLGYGLDAERRDKNKIDSTTGLVKDDFVEEEPKRGGYVFTFYYQAWF